MSDQQLHPDDFIALTTSLLEERVDFKRLSQSIAEQVRQPNPRLNSRSNPRPNRRHILQGEHFEILDPSELPYKHIAVLGHGGMAVVEEVRDIHSGLVYARKTIKINTGTLSKVKEAYQREVEVIKRLESHHHIIRVFATYQTGRTFAIILSPVASEGDLGNFLAHFRELRTGRRKRGMFRILIKAFGCLSNGLSFMHKNTVRHKDIKPQNILVHGGSFIFTDFGISHDYHNDRSTTEGHPGAFTRRYCAPEVIEWGQRNSSSDVFSLGCVFLEILASRFPCFFAPQFIDEPFNIRIDVVRSKLKLVEDFVGKRPQYSLPMAITRNMLCEDPAARDSAALVDYRFGNRANGRLVHYHCYKCREHSAKEWESYIVSHASELTCRICSKAFPGDYELKVHFRRFHKSFKLKYRCTYPLNQQNCGRSFDSRKKAFIHISRKHIMVPTDQINSWRVQMNSEHLDEPNLYVIYTHYTQEYREVKTLNSDLKDDPDSEDDSDFEIDTELEYDSDSVDDTYSEDDSDSVDDTYSEDDSDSEDDTDSKKTQTVATINSGEKSIHLKENGDSESTSDEESQYGIGRLIKTDSKDDSDLEGNPDHSQGYMKDSPDKFGDEDTSKR